MFGRFYYNKNLGAFWENIIALSYIYIGYCALAYHKKWKLCFAFFDNDIMGDATCEDPEFFFDDEILLHSERFWKFTILLH